MIDDERESDAAATALQHAGFAPGDINVFHGVEGLKSIEAEEQSESLLAKISRALMDIEGGVVREAFSDAMRGGASFVLVHLREPEQQRQRAEDMLKQHHAYMLVLFGPLTWERLPHS